MNKKAIVSIIFTLMLLVFFAGTIAFAYVHYQNSHERDNLLENGFRTEALVLSKDKQVTRKLNQQSMRWQYFDNYYLTFSYKQDTTQNKQFETSLKDYLESETTIKSTFVPIKSIDITSPVEKRFYSNIKVGYKVSIIYLLGDPNSARILDNEGVLPIPSLYIFGIISFVLFLVTALMFRYFLKTGKTF